MTGRMTTGFRLCGPASKAIFSVLWLFAAASHPGFAQLGSLEQEVLVRFSNGREIQVGEFLHAFSKRVESSPESKTQTYRQGLREYIDFVRKVMEAESLGLDTTAAFREEFEGYVQQLRESYLREGEVLHQLVEEAYERSQVDIRAAHLLLRFPPNPSASDTLAIYTTAMRLRDSCLYHGMDFSELAQRHSQDPKTAPQGGDLGYFSVLEMVYPFESEAYRTPTGDVSLPVRTNHGYHLIQVRDRVLAGAKKRAAHILVRIPSEEKTASELARTKALNLYGQLQEGGDFDRLAALFSDDSTTAFRAGDLGEERLLPELEAYKYRLGVGQYSEPFLTPHGWHILTVTAEKSPTRPAEIRAELRLRIRQDERYSLARHELIEKLRAEYRYRANRQAALKLAEALGKHYARLNRLTISQVSPDLLAETIYTFADTRVSVFEFLDAQLRSPLRLRSLYGEALEEIEKVILEDIQVHSAEEILRYESDHLSVRYPEYRALLREYHDGMLLFTLMEQRVWRRAVSDSANLRAYYADHLEAFYRPPSVRVVRIQGPSVETLEKLLQQIREGATPQVNQVLAEAPDSPAWNFSYTVQAYLISEDASGRLAEFLLHRPGWASAIEQQADGSFSVDYYAELVHPGGIVPFERCRSEVIRAYQRELEAEWSRALVRKYPAYPQERVIRRLIKSLR